MGVTPGEGRTILGSGCSITTETPGGIASGLATSTAPLASKTRAMHKQHKATTMMMVRMIGMGEVFCFTAQRPLVTDQFGLSIIVNIYNK